MSPCQQRTILFLPNVYLGLIMLMAMVLVTVLAFKSPLRFNQRACGIHSRTTTRSNINTCNGETLPPCHMDGFLQCLPFPAPPLPDLLASYLSSPVPLSSTHSLQIASPKTLERVVKNLSRPCTITTSAGLTFPEGTYQCQSPRPSVPWAD